ncbi:MAG: nitroreductase family protein [Deltaproteobacteria bacterium]|nr:nitroreductase family protein [Deltaproteobacteria bacterium]
MDKNTEIFYAISKKRKSIRAFKPDSISDEITSRLLEELRNSESAANRQPWHFIVLKGEDKKRFDHVFTKDGFKTAPLCIVGCAEPKQAWVRKSDNANYAEIDVTIALTRMISAATAEGIGSCWIAAFDPIEVRKTLSLPDAVVPVGIIALGYPETELKVEEKPRKPLKEILHHGKWQG